MRMELFILFWIKKVMMCKYSNEALVVCYALCIFVHRCPNSKACSTCALFISAAEGFRRSVSDVGADDSPPSFTCCVQKNVD